MAKQRMSTRERLQLVDKSLLSRLKRVRKRLLPILQIGLAAGFAYFLARDVAGHPRPFFAPISVVIIIGMSGGDRVSKSVDMALGCVLGVLVGDLIFYRLGDGGWQIAVIVAGSLLIASFFSSSILVNNQAAIGAILIATIMPPGAEVTGIDRTVDAVIGCLVAMATIALIPQAPMSSARAEVSKVMGIVSSVLDDVATGIQNKDPQVIHEALDMIRGTQTGIDDLAAAIKSGEEASRVSPFLWGTRRYINSLARVIPPVDNAVRTSRVLARRAQVLVEDDDEATQTQVEILDQLSHVCLELSEVYDVNSRVAQAKVIPDCVNELRMAAQRAGMDIVPENAVLSAYAILAQTRSLIVDLLMVCGMSRESALAALVPTSTTPKYEPETFDFE
ncbi:FUSC family protein [Corynebacterium lujinxingii]|uniref:Aromatic acid exporter family protein n=1 Tax=Corynebacterium lujinxingii TaxID=2763010 RepID=A0A7H0JYA3_9CORY|nr:FUSC family protein [Corynebacterium lujinxingii]MBC3178282.1 aromatic acid exporter family protein [Corynebacterium lujinxingii]NNO10840.1 aromatic acid exporter family protein [Corynebacterium lujinxingii]QNP90019.1 aromatic acid exporter family protein [Corynebacterium lujinxingii]